METDDERNERHLMENRGVWFASNKQQENWAEDQVKKGLLTPLKNFFPESEHTGYWYAKNMDCVLNYFNSDGLWCLFGVLKYQDYQI